MQTTGYVSLEPLGLRHPERVWHDWSDWVSLRRALRAIGVGPDDVFVDIGAGKGHVVLLAATFPLKRVLGVELSEDLADVARRNVQAAAPKLRAEAVEIVTADATTYRIPDDVSVVYLFCPFIGDSFRRATAQILDSMDRRPRELRIVYNYPYEHAYLLSTRRVAVEGVRSARWPPRSRAAAEVIVTYRVLPDGSDPAEAAVRLPRAARRWAGPYDPGFALKEPPTDATL